MSLNRERVLAGTPISFKASSGTVLFTPTSVANGAGRISTQYDRGSGVQPVLYRWRARTKAAAALVAGALLEMYLVTSDGTTVDGNFGAVDAAWSTTEKRRNLKTIGFIEADSTTNGEVQQASGKILIEERYFSIAWWNGLGQALSGTAADHEFILTPYHSVSSPR